MFYPATEVYMVRMIRRFLQRGRRGYSDEDLWDLQHYLSCILADALPRLADTGRGYPCRCPHPEDPDRDCHCEVIWGQELRENGEKFRLAAEDKYETTDELVSQSKTSGEAIVWFSKNFWHLWD